MNAVALLKEIFFRTSLPRADVAKLLGASSVSINRWERGASEPSPVQTEQIQQIYDSIIAKQSFMSIVMPKTIGFRAHANGQQLGLFESPFPSIEFSQEVLPSILKNITNGKFFDYAGIDSLTNILNNHPSSAITIDQPPLAGMSAGKNSYTYDAHTYHTKVPPQGIAELLLHYLPDGGLVFDPFAGSGMTGVAARSQGYDCILNELSPAACFIANRFTTQIEPQLFAAGISALLEELDPLRTDLYTTICRECGRNTEILYTVWSYSVICDHCQHEFLLWDHCRKYGERVRDHKILTEFPCPKCKTGLKKSTLKRTKAEPVQVGYKCCKSHQQEITHPPTEADLEKIQELERNPRLAEGFYPNIALPAGVNLRQPAKHGLDRVDKFYTPRNLAALSHIWKTIHRIQSPELAAELAFVFTSLYQRVTRMSEFRFWGGSGNTARFNVPYIFNETNVFLTFIRKAKSIQDHLASTATHYSGNSIVVQNSATALNYLPDESIDLIFTDPPFGANINYSEMNFLWESWLEVFTDNTDEAIINKVQGKDIVDYQRLMTQSMKECFRVLRTGHWLLLVFMNSSKEIWTALRTSIIAAGFEIKKIDTFDKQHGTFKQFVSENTAGFDLVLHCFKHRDKPILNTDVAKMSLQESVLSFLSAKIGDLPMTVYLHVERENEVDYRKLYSDWLSSSLLREAEVMDFSQFRVMVKQWLDRNRKQIFIHKSLSEPTTENDQTTYKTEHVKSIVLTTESYQLLEATYANAKSDAHMIQLLLAKHSQQIR